jgi:uncharacterized repeat protein (TIGR01451 family)
VVTKTVEDKEYKLGETVTFTIKATNIYADARTITLAEIDGVTLAKSTFENVTGGETVETTATYTITEADILNGEFTNRVTAKVGNITKRANATANTVKPNGHLTVTKETTSTAAKDGKYALGETITYKVTVTNDGNLTITNITVTDELTNNEWTVPSLAPGASEEFETRYTVTEADILTGSVVNEATAAGTSPDPKTPEVPVVPGTVTEQTGDPNGHLTVTKETTSTAAKDGKYALGEEITYKVTVTNDGNLTITNITVTDALTGDTWTIASLAPGASVENNTKSYTVTEDDILAGKVVNVATAEGTSPDPDTPEVPVEDGKKEDPAGPKNGHLTVTKTTTSTPANGTSYALGEEITYKVTVTNDGNLTITDITVTDALTGDKWDIDTLAPDGSKDYTATYTVTEADILAGTVKNVATASGKSPDPEKPEVPVKPGVDEEPTDEKRDHLTVTKTTTSEPANGETYALGEEITYEITVTNDGNLTITDITVTDELTGDEWKIEELKPGETSEAFKTSYTVTEDDILAGEVLNVATAKGTSPDPDEPDVPVTPGVDPEPTEDKNGHLTVTKTTTSKASREAGYVVGETITYAITATNDGNLTITDIKVTDEKTGDEWTIDALAPGESKTFNARYVVTAADAAAGSVLNVATAKGTSPDPDKEDVPVTPGENTEEIVPQYRLTVHYYYYGTIDQVADPFTAVYNSGDTYTVTSPVITGYTANQARVTGTMIRNTSINVYYTVNSYNLTVNFVYINGTTAAPSRTIRVNYGAAFSVTAPTVAGFTPNTPVYTGTMPARDVVYTVIYTANPPADEVAEQPAEQPAAQPAAPAGNVPAGGAGNEPANVMPLALDHVPYEILDDYDTALGISNLSMSTGEMYE